MCDYENVQNFLTWLNYEDANCNKLKVGKHLWQVFCQRLCHVSTIGKIWALSMRHCNGVVLFSTFSAISKTTSLYLSSNGFHDLMEERHSNHIPILPHLHLQESISWRVGLYQILRWTAFTISYLGKPCRVSFVQIPNYTTVDLPFTARKQRVVWMQSWNRIYWILRTWLSLMCCPTTMDLPSDNSLNKSFVKY